MADGVLVPQANADKMIKILGILHACITFSNASNLNDINLFLEDVFCEILNLVYDYNLVNLNSYDDVNFPGIDLGDKGLKLCVQVTSTNRRAKFLKTITTFEDKKLYKTYDNLKFFILDLKKPSFRKEFEHDKFYKCDCDNDVMAFDDLFKKFRTLDLKVQSKVLDRLEQNVSSLQSKTNTYENSIELVLVNKLFEFISDELEEITPSNGEEKGVIEDSDLERKKQKFIKFWDYITQNYTAVITTNREMVYQQALSSFNTAEKTRVSEYLKLESREMLMRASDDPVKAINMLVKEIADKFKLSLFPEVEVRYFLYYELYNCDVFPLVD